MAGSRPRECHIAELGRRKQASVGILEAKRSKGLVEGLGEELAISLS